MSRQPAPPVPGVSPSYDELQEAFYYYLNTPQVDDNPPPVFNLSEKTADKLSFELLCDNTELNFWLYDTEVHNLMLNDSDETRLSEAVIEILSELYNVEIEYLGINPVTENQINTKGFSPISW